MKSPRSSVLGRFSLAMLLPALVLPMRSAKAQTSAAEISARLLRKPLYLRGAWGEDELQFDATGKPAQPYKIVTFTIAGVDITKVQVRGARLLLQGNRVGLVFGNNGALTRVVIPYKKREEQIFIEVDAPKKDFGPALDALFTPDLSAIPSACDGPWNTYAKRHWSATAAATDMDATAGETPATAVPYTVAGDVTPPHILHQTDPEFSEPARAVGYSGNVTVGLWVEPDGSTSHLEILRPAGLGLDEQALTAVAQYRFSPAHKDGQPVAVRIKVAVKFQIFQHTRP